jgi:hypothetical protein
MLGLGLRGHARRVVVFCRTCLFVGFDLYAGS